MITHGIFFSKGLCIKGKSFDLVFILICWEEWNREQGFLHWVVTCFSTSIFLLFICCYAYDRFPHSPCSWFSPLFFSFPSPLRSRSCMSENPRTVPVITLQRLQVNQLSQGSGLEVSTLKRHSARSPRHVSLHRRRLNKFGTVAGEVGNFA